MNLQIQCLIWMSLFVVWFNIIFDTLYSSLYSLIYFISFYFQSSNNIFSLFLVQKQSKKKQNTLVVLKWQIWVKQAYLQIPQKSE